MCKASANVFNLQHIVVLTYLFDHVVLASLSDGLIRFKSLRQPRDRSRTSSTNQVMRLGSMALQNQKPVFTRVAPRFHMVCSFRACNLLGGTRSNSLATSLTFGTMQPARPHRIKQREEESVGADELTLIFFLFGKKFIDINREPECPNTISM